MTIGQLLQGKRIKMIEDCGVNKKGMILKVYVVTNGFMRVGSEDNFCSCVEKWELVDGVEYKPAPHKHRLTCTDCGEEIKR